MARRQPRIAETAASRPDTQRSVTLRIPVTTILKVVVALALGWALVKLVPTLILVWISMLVAVALAPLVARLERRGVSHGAAVAIVAAGTILVLALFVVVVFPPLASETLRVATHLPAFRRSVDQRLTDWPVLSKIVDQIFELPSSPEIAKSLKRPLAWGRLAVELVVAAVLGLFLSFYWLLEGKRAYAWGLAYLPRRHRPKATRTMPEIADVVVAYMQGQLIASSLCGAYTFAVLTVLGVPAAVTLALLAAACDALPVLGVLVSSVPAVLLALTVSPFVAGAVLALYLLYHALENSVILPRVYGRRLRLSTLAVLIGLLVGIALAGVLGPILVLPLFAAYPIVEKVWLEEYLGRRTTAEHAALADAPSGESEDTIDAILEGRSHGG